MPTLIDVSGPGDLSQKPANRKTWLRFSLLFLLVVMLIASVFFARYGVRHRAYLRERDRIVPTAFDISIGKNIFWKAKVGSTSYGSPVVSNGKVFVGTNNGSGYLRRYSADYDLGVLLCFDAANGEFLWQSSTEKLKAGRVHDWPLQGICSTPYVERDRLWYVTSRCEVVCLDTEGFLDEEDDGWADPEELAFKKGEADVVWQYDMIAELGVLPHNMSASSPCVAGDTVFAVTGRGVDEGHVNLPNPDAPSFIALDKKTGKLLWADNSPGKNVLDGQWSSPTYAVLGGVPQVLFPGGDGWLYSFDPQGTPEGRGKLLWKFDCNPKHSKWILGGRGTRNNLMNAATVYDDRVYIAVGQDPEHGEGEGHVWCIDPTKRGDVSPEIVFNKHAPNDPILHKRLIACNEDKGDFTKTNPNSAVIWHFSKADMDGDGQIDFEEQMHRSLSRIVVEDDLAFFTDFSGLVHCLDARNGNPLWFHDVFAGCWSTPVIAANHVIVGDEDGEVTVFGLSGDPNLAMPLGRPVSISDVDSSIYPTPTIHKGVLYVLSREWLYAIADPANRK